MTHQDDVITAELPAIDGDLASAPAEQVLRQVLVPDAHNSAVSCGDVEGSEAKLCCGPPWPGC